MRENPLLYVRLSLQVVKLRETFLKIPTSKEYLISISQSK